MRLQVHPREESVELVSEAHHIQRVSSFVCIWRSVSHDGWHKTHVCRRNSAPLEIPEPSVVSDFIFSTMCVKSVQKATRIARQQHVQHNPVE